MVGCSSPVNNENTEEIEKGKADTNEGKTEPGNQEQKEEKDEVEKQEEEAKDVHNLDSVFQFVKSKYDDYTREDFDKWTPNYFDITGDGVDEVILSNTYYDGNLRSALVITLDGGEFKEIPSYIPMAKYENNMRFEDGFLVIESKSGGTGAYYYDMDLYVYDGHRLIDAIDGNIKIKEEVAAPDTDYSINSKIEGDLNDFVITLTKFDNLTEKEEVIAKNQYIYNSDSMVFKRKPISLSNTAKSFDNIYNGNNLREAIEYYHENLYNFSKEKLKDYSIKMIAVIARDRDKLYPMGDSPISYITSEYYDIKTNELHTENLADDIKESLNFISKRKIYNISKSFYANEGKVDDAGFVVSIDSWTFEMLKPALDFAYSQRHNPYDYSNLDPLVAPSFTFSSVKQVENTMIVYPNIYIYNYNDAKKLEGADTWKARVILPVNIVE